MSRLATLKNAVLTRIALMPRGAIAFLAAVVVAFVVLYLPVGMILVNRIDDNLEYGTAEPPHGASRAVAISAALVEREAVRWRPNDPFFLPGAWLDRMPNFQKGIVAAVSRFSLELTDQLSRTRGSSQVDPDLERAVGHLKAQPEIWVFDFKTSMFPTTSSNAHYISAVKGLRDYNDRLTRGQANFEVRADNLLGTLDRIAADMGAASAALDAHIRLHKGWGWDTEADAMFYNVKGRSYAYYLILRELGQDYAPVLAERQLTHAWNEMLDSLREAASLRPFWVLNLDPNSELFANHLANLGFYLMRGRTQLREVSNILTK